jgi:Domain of unknown function DUF87.
MVNKSGVDIIGFSHDGKAYAIPSMYRVHTAIFGETGSGKSETMKLLILQCIKRREGFILIDPHGKLAREILALIPTHLCNNVIYINPATALWFKRVIKINPLYFDNIEEKYVTVASFINVLKNLYSDSWGDRLETILRNALNLLISRSKNITLKDLRALITNQELRNSILRDITDLDTLYFWYEIFEKNYKKESIGVVYNKLDKILSTPLAMVMLEDSNRSSISITHIIRENKFVIVDLASIASDDIVAFLGSIIIHMLYVEARKSIDFPFNNNTIGITNNVFNLFIDEAHLFHSFAIREVLNTLRKFNIKVTLATQSVNAFNKDIAEELLSLCRTIICFRCDLRTAMLVKDLMPISKEELVSLPLHTFAFYTQADPPIRGIALSKSIIPKEYYRWIKAAKNSVNIYGDNVTIEYKNSNYNTNEYRSNYYNIKATNDDKKIIL